jgi:hypothetical protein
MTLVLEAVPVLDPGIVPADASLLPVASIGNICERNPKDPTREAMFNDHATGAPEICAVRENVLTGQGLLSCGECACARLIEIAQVDTDLRATLADKIVDVNHSKEIK